MLTVFPIHRVLPLDGGNGSVMCRMHLQETSRSIPRQSAASRIECATRSLLRMNNLVAVRGNPGQSMVGPADYYTNLENPEQCHYTIQIDNGIPQFTESHAPSATTSQQTNLTPLANNMMTRVNVNWVSGRDKATIQSTQAHYASANPSFGESLFPNPGILEVKSASDCAALPSFDPRNVDLSPFKARLVANNAPFQITSVQLPANDEYRAVSFLYEPGYARNQIEHGGGLFLETHEFSQTMTPLDTNSKGFVTLGIGRPVLAISNP